jgi:quercetin dioxygenase-like cupin family protein
MRIFREAESAKSFQFFRPRSEAPALAIPGLGLELLVLLPVDASGKALTVIETSNAPGFGPPLHRHGETEVFRVLEGRYLFEVDGQQFEAGTGEVIAVPGGTAHAFVNITDKPARQLVIIVPGMDALGFFLGLSKVFARGRPDRDTLNAFGKPWDVEFLGPPLSPKKR